MDKTELLAGGFVPTIYEGQDGEFLTKKCPVESLPYSDEQLINNKTIYGNDEAVTEVMPDGRVQPYTVEFVLPDGTTQPYVLHGQRS